MYVVRQDKRMKQLYRWAIPIILAVVLVWWCFPRSMIPKHESVAGVHISGGMTGKGFDSNDPLQVDAVVRALSEIKTVRTLPLLGSTGFDYTLFFYDASGNLLREAYLYSDKDACIGISNVRMIGAEGLTAGLEALIETGDANQLLLVRAGTAAAKAAETDDAVLAEYHGHEVTRQGVLFWQKWNTLTGNKASEEETMRKALLNIMLEEAAEAEGLAPSPEDEAAYVASQKEAYDQLPEARQFVDTYCIYSGMSLDSYWAEIEDGAHGILARGALKNRFLDTFRTEHEAELILLDEAGQREAEADAWEVYEQKLYESRKTDVVFY